ncbi:MAG TPA: ATP-binding cassette domain-containing protein [Anaerolineaceae bacterium]|nr:ATP-binding cassette domain-containing protein [Anaerolineaceae bacterium]HPN53973.1 ATP-binding cassette domain-containing protein [Anaerolineaceae bacterium]
MTDVMLAVRNVSKAFGAHQVVDNLSFTLNRADRLAIFAPSGAGKTTLLRLVAGLEQPDSGDITLQARSVITIFQEPRLFPFLTVEENIFLPFKAQGRAISPSDRQNASRWLEVSELLPFIHHYPCQLSGGMKQKAALIRGLLGHPDLVLLDEPFQSIGVESRQSLIRFMLDFTPGQTLLLVTHSGEEIQQLAQKVLVFQQPCLTRPRECFVENFSESGWPARQHEIMINNSDASPVSPVSAPHGLTY